MKLRGERSHQPVEDPLLRREIRSASLIDDSFGTCRAIALALRGRVRVRSIVGLGGVLPMRMGLGGASSP